MVTMSEADDFYRAKGAVKAGDLNVETRRMTTHMFRHYFLPNGREIGYVTVPMMEMEGYTLKTFDDPRVWGELMKRTLRMVTL